MKIKKKFKKMIITKMDYFRKSKDTTLYDAINTSNSPTALKLIEQGANVNFIQSNVEKKSLLMLAMEKNMLEVFEGLVEKGANLEFKDKEGNTVLNLLAQKNENDSKMIKNEMIKNKMIKNKMIKNKMIKILFDHEANINTKNNYGQTPLMFFSCYDNNNIYNYVRSVENVLETMKPDLNIEDDSERTALFYAASYNQSKNLVLLLQYMQKNLSDMKANIYKILNYTPDDELNPDVDIEYFTDAFLNVDADFYSLLSFALKRNNEKMLNYLINIAFKKNINISDKNILELALKKDDLNNEILLNYEILKKILNLTDKKTILETFPYYLYDRKGEYTKETSILLNHLEENNIRFDDDKILKDLLKFNLTDKNIQFVNRILNRIFNLSPLSKKDFDPIIEQLQDLQRLNIQPGKN